MIYILVPIMVLIMTLFVLNEVYLWHVMRNSQEVQVVRAKKSKKKYDAIAFGSAYCRHSIDFGEFNGFNFGIGSQFFYYTDKMLREIAPLCLKKGGTVFLIIADLVFAEEGKGLYGPERYQLMLSRKTLDDEYNFGTYFKVRFPLLYNPRLIKRLVGHYYHLIRGDYSMKEVVTFNEEMARQAAVERCNSWCREFGLKDTKSADIPQVLLDKFIKTRSILSGMIHFCIDNGYKPVLVVTPVSAILNDEMSEEFLNIVLFQNIKLANQDNVPFLNYLRDVRFSDYKCYSKSADLLDKSDRLRFTKILLTDSGWI